MDKVLRYSAAFSRLPLVVRRAAWFLCSLALFVFGLRVVLPISDQAGTALMLAGTAGMIWASGFWLVLYGMVVVVGYMAKLLRW